jgi:AraC-like DNA-binding protein
MRQRHETPVAPLIDSAEETKEKGPQSKLDTRGILRPRRGFQKFALTRADPPPDLRPFVTFFWTVCWDLAAGETYEQEILPFPCVNLACEEGQYRVHGPGTARFVAKLEGKAWVTGARFTPAGFSAFSSWPMRRLVDRVAPAIQVIGREPPPFPSTPDEAREHLATYLREQHAEQSETQTLVDRLVARAQDDPSVVRVAMLAAEADVSPRSLHRLFERYVGVSSKWIVRRARVQGAAERVARGEAVDWASVAQELGYHDQAHLIRDFRAQMGETPNAYAKRCQTATKATDESDRTPT